MERKETPEDVEEVEPHFVYTNDPECHEDDVPQGFS